MATVYGRKVSTAHIPEWGGDVCVRSLSVSERLDLEDAIARLRDDSGGIGHTACIVMACACDNYGHQLFTAKDMAAVAQKSTTALRRVANEAIMINGLFAGEVARRRAHIEQSPTRIMVMRLALALGKSVRELLDCMDSAELANWLAYDQISPFGSERTDLGAAIVASTVANVWRGKGQKAYKVDDFLPKFTHKQASMSRGMELKAKLLAALGGRVRHSQKPRGENSE